MKKYLTALMLVAALTGCDDASKAIEQAQDAANDAVDSLQEKIESVDLNALNLDQFGEAADSAEKLAESVQAALEADFSNPQALNDVKEHIANAYSCLVDVSSESAAEKLMDKVMESISNEEAQSLIERGVEKAKEAQECVM
ncbi:lipoprotein [Vibrio renipiscarius]|uniref:Lipoprotein n=1 Tax=Vibrio renipiscarius TaxID=1461322 RepID=A0A0C2JJ96_9VIBR|nr:lipoprotein [Vibrio renipiscarius]KII76434.1 lipoprotein [Vibrio renipiscarius]KII78044.1 lipoprotein [Vibrio renipiscarius]